MSVVCWPTTGNRFVSNARTYDGERAARLQTLRRERVGQGRVGRERVGRVREERDAAGVRDERDAVERDGHRRLHEDERGEELLGRALDAVVVEAEAAHGRQGRRVQRTEDRQQRVAGADATGCTCRASGTRCAGAGTLKVCDSSSNDSRPLGPEEAGVRRLARVAWRSSVWQPLQLWKRSTGSSLPVGFGVWRRTRRPRLGRRQRVVERCGSGSAGSVIWRMKLVTSSCRRRRAARRCPRGPGTRR